MKRIDTSRVAARFSEGSVARRLLDAVTRSGVNLEALEKKYAKITPQNLLGCGVNGCTWSVGDGRVVKITMDARDGNAALALREILKDKDLDSDIRDAVVNVHYACNLASGWYLIVMDEVKAIDIDNETAHTALQFAWEIAQRGKGKGPWGDVAEKFGEVGGAAAKAFIGLCKLNEQYDIGLVKDAHHDNFGINAKGGFSLFDFGYSNIGEKAPETIMEACMNPPGENAVWEEDGFLRGRVFWLPLKGKQGIWPVEIRASEFFFPPPPPQAGEIRLEVIGRKRETEGVRRRAYVTVTAMPFVSDPNEYYDFKKDIPKALWAACRITFEIINRKLVAPLLEEWRKQRFQTFVSDTGFFLTHNRPATANEATKFMELAKNKWITGLPL